MPPLPSDLRRVLENAVIAARDEATTAAGAALKRLAVTAKEFPSYLTAEERALRPKLRAAARQLGDPWNAEKQAFGSLTKLTHEVAYEHWHRMLFARFLAENNLLMHPDHGVNVDLATVAELAQEEAAKSGTKADTWAMAGRFAAGMLPQIFRPDDPALAVQLAPEHQQALEKLLESLPPSTFTADDSLGWVYQFWQSAEKERVNNGVKAGDKITGATLPAVTQLFTEHYMVLFLLHNTVGAWWAGRQIAKMSKEHTAKWKSEADARAAVALPGYSFDYLRFVKDEAAGTWRPAAGTFNSWPKLVKALKILDPCGGSGHFLVAVLELLTFLRKIEEGLSPRDATAAVISDNLFGLELDPRCTQIAAFNVALAAWKISGEHAPLPEMHIACSGLGPNCTEDEWVQTAELRMSPSRRSASNTLGLLPVHGREAVRNGLRSMHALFSAAPELGSLIDPTQLTSNVFVSADWETMRPFLADVMAEESKGDDTLHERAVAAQGMAKAAEILAGDYTLVITNVPYLAQRRQGATLRRYLISQHADAKADLATAMIDRYIGSKRGARSFAAVTPQHWLYQDSYIHFRTRLLRTSTWELIPILGPGAFETISGEIVNVALPIISDVAAAPNHSILAVDCTSMDHPSTKAQHLITGEIIGVTQSTQLTNPDARITLSEGTTISLLGTFASTPQGIITGDLDHWQRKFWELREFDQRWQKFLSTTSIGLPYAGREHAIDWTNEGAEMIRPRPGNAAVGHDGVAISQIGHLPASLYVGELYDGNVAPIIPNKQAQLPAIYTFCGSQDFHDSLRVLDKNMKVTNGVFLKVTFDLARWQKVAAEKYPNGLPEPQSDDPTQWLFHGYPGGRAAIADGLQRDNASALQVAVARLVGYRWPGELDLKMRLAPEVRAWVQKCNDLRGFADDDGVVPLAVINKEAPGAERVRGLLEAAWKQNMGGAPPLNDLLAAAGAAGKSLDDWLRGGDFFAQHCAMFHQRPFIWQIWDGKKEGFNILVLYHRLVESGGKGKKLLEKIVYTYLGDWITQQQAAAKQGVAGADLRLKAAQDLQKKLETIIAGEPPFDIFVRWKPLRQQPIGWDPDINDGVRVNIRPFVTAGVLRGKVNVKWTKDRGKEPASIRPKAEFPWFWNCPEDEPPIDFAGGNSFTGERLNDLHYTNKAKQAAREKTENDAQQDAASKARRSK